jgi:hypothetical protein
VASDDFNVISWLPISHFVPATAAATRSQHAEAETLAIVGRPDGR